MFQGAKLCICCSKPGHIAPFCYKTKNKDQKIAKNAKGDDNYEFIMRNGTHSKSKWIMNSEAFKHIILHRATLDSYEVVVPRNVLLDIDIIVEDIGTGFIIIKKILWKSCILMCMAPC